MSSTLAIYICICREAILFPLKMVAARFFLSFFFGTRGVSHCGLAIYIKKDLKAKEEELWKLKYFTMQKYNLQKSSKTNQNPLRYYNSTITNLKFQHKPKYHLSKILI
jgi:hypothetical protein